MDDTLEFKPRKRRSDNPREATKLALEASCKRAGFEALAVVDTDGRILASCGDTDVCLAMARRAADSDHGTIQRRELLKAGDHEFEATITTVPEKEGPYYVCAAGGDSERIDSETVTLARAVLRINPR